MCMNGKCNRCGAACKAPEPTRSTVKAGAARGDGLFVAKKTATDKAVAKARSLASGTR